MLRKKQRLTTAAFNEVFQVGKRLHTPELQLIYLRADDFHAAVVVGKKVSKTAVGRNRLRRQIYAAVYRFLQTHALPYIVIVVAKPAAKQVPSRQVARVVEEALQQLKAR